jgi:hypothetical protein
MEDNKIIKLAAIIIVGSVVIPIAIDSIWYIGATVVNSVNKVKFNKKIKKGLKDGSIIEIDGKFYGVEVSKEEV